MPSVAARSSTPCKAWTRAQKSAVAKPAQRSVVEERGPGYGDESPILSCKGCRERYERFGICTAIMAACTGLYLVLLVLIVRKSSTRIYTSVCAADWRPIIPYIPRASVSADMYRLHSTPTLLIDRACLLLESECRTLAPGLCCGVCRAPLQSSKWNGFRRTLLITVGGHRQHHHRAAFTRGAVCLQQQHIRHTPNVFL